MCNMFESWNLMCWEIKTKSTIIVTEARIRFDVISVKLFDMIFCLYVLLKFQFNRRTVYFPKKHLIFCILSRDNYLSRRQESVNIYVDCVIY